MCPRPSSVPRTLGHELDLVGHGSAQLVAGKAAIGALEPLGKVAVVASDGERARVGCLMHSHTQFLFGFEVDTIPSPAEPVGRKGVRVLRLWNLVQGLEENRGKGTSSQGPPGWAETGQRLRVMRKI